MSRRKAREIALQTLFALDFNNNDTETALEASIEEYEEISEKAKAYARLLVLGTEAHRKEIDEAISGISLNWKLDRMAAIDRNIVRIAIYELQFGEEEISPSVVINEAVEVAKAFGGEDSSRFINGVLASWLDSRKTT